MRMTWFRPQAVRRFRRSPAWQSSTAKIAVSILGIAGLVAVSAAQSRGWTAENNAAVPPGSAPQVVNSMAVEDTSLWADTDNGFFVFHDNRSDTTNDPVPDAWNIYGQPLEFDAVKVYADGGIEIDIDPEDDSNATVSSALDATVTYVIRLSSGDHSVTVVHEGDIADVKIVPDNADEVREFHDQLAAGTEGTAVVSDEPPEPPDKVINSMTVEDTSLWAADNGFFVFHDNRSDTTNDPVPDAWNIYGQPLEFDAVKVYADGSVLVDIDTEDDSNATVSSALDPTVRYVIQLSSGDHSVIVVHEGDIADVKIVPDNADEVGEFHARLTAGTAGTAAVSDDPNLLPDEPDAPAAPSVSLNGAQTVLEMQFNASFAAGETKAFAMRIRAKTRPSDSRTHCRALENTGNEAVDTVITARVFIASFAQANTTYLADYRHVGTSCSDAADNPWSQSAEFTVTRSPGSDFDIDIAFVGQPPPSVVSAVNAAASTWERVITSDLVDIDFSLQPTSNACTDGTFDGVVDDLRIYVYVEHIDGIDGTAARAGFCVIRRFSGLPVIGVMTLDAADVDRFGSATLYNVALHEIAHTLGFGLLWNGLLANPSLRGGQPVVPPPDTHFRGANAIAAFDDAGGTNYQGNKVPVENERGGSGSQDSHWRYSVMGSELMTYATGASASFSAITVQSMADLGYSVDASVADAYTVADTTGRAALTAKDQPLPNCVVHPPTDIEIVPETGTATLPSSAIQMQVIDPIELKAEPR